MGSQVAVRRPEVELARVTPPPDADPPAGPAPPPEAPYVDPPFDAPPTERPTPRGCHPLVFGVAMATLQVAATVWFMGWC